jgi:hypothetical protein
MSLIRVKHYANDQDKMQKKCERVVKKLQSLDMKTHPVVMVVYSMTCGHCIDFMNNKRGADGSKVMCEWRKFRKWCLANKCIVVQVNISAASVLADALENSKNACFQSMIQALRETNAVPSLYAGGEALQAYDGARNFSSLVQYMSSLPK